MADTRTYLKLTATMIAWGGTWVAARVAVAHAPPLAVGVWRFLIAAASLLLLLFLRERRLPSLARREIGIVFAMGTTGIFLYNLFFLSGMQHLEAGRGALVVAVAPVLTLLSAAWILGEGMNANKATGSLIAGIGCLTVIGHGDPLAWLAGRIGIGEVLILGCALSWTAYTLLGRFGTQTMSPLAMTTYASSAGFVMLLAAALVHDPGALITHYPPLAWLAIFFLGLFGTTLGFTWFSGAVQAIGAQRASVFINLVPVAAVLLGALFLGERLDASALVGGALIIGGVWLTQRPAFAEATR